MFSILKKEKCHELLLRNFNEPVNFYYVHWFKSIVSILYLWKLLSRDFSNYPKKKGGGILLFLSIMLYPLASFFIGSVWIQRFIFFILMIPAVPRLWNILFSGILIIGGGRYYQNILKGLAIISLAIFIIPGFYLPPFYDGIAGWSHENDTPSSYQDMLIRIRFSDNSSALFRPSFFNPITQEGRAIQLINRRDKNFFESNKFYDFLFSLYEKSYPSLINEKLPTQKKLGSFAYSPHSLDKYDIREKYLPASEIISFEWVQINNISGARSEKIMKYWTQND